MSRRNISTGIGLFVLLLTLTSLGWFFSRDQKKGIVSAQKPSEINPPQAPKNHQEFFEFLGRLERCTPIPTEWIYSWTHLAKVMPVKGDSWEGCLLISWDNCTLAELRDHHYEKNGTRQWDIFVSYSGEIPTDHLLVHTRCNPCVDGQMFADVGVDYEASALGGYRVIVYSFDPVFTDGAKISPSQENYHRKVGYGLREDCTFVKVADSLMSPNGWMKNPDF